MKKRRRLNLKRVLLAIIILIIIIGGIIIMINKKLDSKNSKETSSSNTKKETTKEEITKDEEEAKTNANLESAPNNLTEFTNLEDGEYLTKTGHILTIENHIASVDGHLIVNKTYAIPSSYQPTNPQTPATGESCLNCLETEVMSAFKLMQSDASSIGLNIYIASGYRSYTYQDKLYNNYSAVSGQNQADTYSARPGHSEHQTGLCFDLNSVNDSFATTDEGIWINNNAYLYGFIIRYPKGKDEITGYQYESWHLRYVGPALAKELYNNGNWLTLEEYYGLSSSY